MDKSESEEKIGFKLERDEDGYPPADWEWLWASRVGEGTFKIDNIPFFAKGVSCDDIVTAEQTAKGLIFRGLHRPSGHSTVRVVVYQEDREEGQVNTIVQDIRQSLQNLGCATELSHIPNLIAVDIPPNVNYESISAFLSEKEEEELLEYEEAALA